ncbi:MAG TPA: glycosyltransferase [Chitinophagaceae bacterium]|nr:glycosyltransferase [Chitinophagaceae bacterium]
MLPETKTLVILSPGFPSDESDTACLPAQQQFVQQVQESFPGMQVIVFSFHYPFRKSDYQWKNVRVISFNGSNKGGVKRLMLWYAVWRRLSSLKKQYNIIGLLSLWCTECALIGKYFSKKHHVPHFIWILGQDAKKDNRYVSRIQPKDDELIALSDFVADEFERNHGVRPRYVIPFGIDERLYGGHSGGRDIDVLGAGSLIPLKQYNVFVDVVAEATKVYPGIRAVICGKGPEQALLQSQVQRLGLASNISLVGELPNEDILKLMQRTKVFLHPSSYEGFGMVCLEALYAGAHVISFCKPMERDIAHWHVVGTPDEMLKKMLELLDHASLGHSPIMPYSMNETTIAAMRLFDV